MQQIALSEATAARRRIPIVCVSDADGVTPMTGQTFSAAELQVSKNGAAEANSAGSVVELAGGGYYYQATAAELDTRGFVTLRSAKTDVRFYGLIVHVQVGAEGQFAEGLFNLADGVEPGLKFKEYCQATWSTTSGKSAGAGTGSVTYRNKADTLNRVTATVSGNNRTAMSYNFTV